MKKTHVKKGDKVLVLAGKDKGKIGEVLSADAKSHTVVVANVNILVHHNKPKSREEKGGIVKAPGAIDASNVMVVCPACGKATRIAHKKNDKNKSVRICKKCGAVLDSKVKLTKEKKAAKPSVKEVAKLTTKQPEQKPAEKIQKSKTEKTAKTAAEKPAEKVAKTVKAEKPAEKTVKTEKTPKPKTAKLKDKE